MFLHFIVVPARSAGASWSETGLPNDQVPVRPVCPGKLTNSPNGICAGQMDRYHSGYFSVDFQCAEKNAVSR